MRLFNIKRTIWAALAFGIMLSLGSVAPASAQQQAPADEAALLLQLKGGPVTGRVSIPDAKSGVLIQPQGRDWRQTLEGPVKSAGGWLLVLTVVALAAFLAIRGRIKIEHGMSGRTIERFKGIERFAHWLTAICFVILGLSGLNISFGRSLLLPVMGPEAFTGLTAFGKLAHNFLSFPFVLGVLLMAVLWIRHNIFNAIDMEWFRQGGGLLQKGVHPPAGKFNGGQKIIFWLVVLGAAALAVSGYMLMFPFYVTDIAGMQLAQLVHAIAGILMVAVILAHIYIGSIGMEGAFDAMGSGQVDVNWAREHHSLWVKDVTARGAGDD
ncbi:MAG: formate dehydrogenase subunit gamma [Ferrovibrio sp.]|uniref:formate dehydrogenase subunit gamma n=1 Tax=Ferrovibrio sp. TaxID=1917215 RepID=UPI00261D9EA3|nr:formate dehydrogenase subunit gamma [Ferrovibrio sp.]MCW0232547.1 formate dehydrogenase subunit gamma [Ferrovibrio sp.]